MEIKSTMTTHAGQTFSVVYRDIDSPSELEGRTVSGVHALMRILSQRLIGFQDVFEPTRVVTQKGVGVKMTPPIRAIVSL